MKGRISRLFPTICDVGRLNLSIVSIAAVLAVVSCGGGGGASSSGTITTTTTITSVSVVPSTATLGVKQSQQFQATVTGTGNFSTQVQWYVNNISGGNSTYVTITAAGLYTAPDAVPGSGPVTIKATSAADSSKSCTESVTIGAENVQVSVSPVTASVQLNEPRASLPTSQVLRIPRLCGESTTWWAAGLAVELLTGMACMSPRQIFRSTIP